MKIFSKKFHVNISKKWINFIFIFIFAVFIRWINIPNHNEISFWSVLAKYTIWGVVCIILLFVIVYIYNYIYDHKDWMKFYENKISIQTIKSLMDEIGDCSLIENKALEIYDKYNDFYFSSYMFTSRKFNEISDDYKCEKEILEKFQKEIPSLINKIKETEYIPFEDNSYSVLQQLCFSFIFININENNIISYDYDKNIKQVINSRIMNDVIKNNSKEDILAYTLLYLFYGNYSF